MAEPQISTQQEKPTEGNRASARATDGERRSFQDAPKEVAATSERAVDAARGMVQATSEAGKGLAEHTRRGVGEVGELWRQSLDPFLALNMDMSRMFDDLWRHAAGCGAVPSLRTARPFGVFSAAPFAGLPATDVKETDQAYHLSVELAGLEKEDVELTLRGDTLLICGQKSEEKSQNNTAYRMSERRFGRFERSFPLPPDVDRAKIRAALRNGLLSIDLPKSQDARTRTATIAIQ